MTTATLDELRERANAHQQHLDRNTVYLSIADLRARWGCSANTVRAIPFPSLPYLNIGTGLQREYRRYHPDAVYAYELASRAAKRSA